MNGARSLGSCQQHLTEDLDEDESCLRLNLRQRPRSETGGRPSGAERWTARQRQTSAVDAGPVEYFFIAKSFCECEFFRSGLAARLGCYGPPKESDGGLDYEVCCDQKQEVGLLCPELQCYRPSPRSVQIGDSVGRLSRGHGPSEGRIIAHSPAHSSEIIWVRILQPTMVESRVSHCSRTQSARTLHRDVDGIPPTCRVFSADFLPQGPPPVA